jgi:hyperosmotically inducible protein
MRRGLIFPIAAILALSCTATDRSYPKNLSQYAPLAASRVSTFGESPLEERVHRALLNLSSFGVFDHLAFTVNGSAVVLFGQAFHPYLREDAADLVATLPGVGQVVDLITYLPNSPADNSIRIAVFSAIYSHPRMSIYSTVGSGGAIHIVVDGGKVSLEGEVGSSVDSRRALSLARVPGVVAVTNHLTVGH